MSTTEFEALRRERAKAHIPRTMMDRPLRVTDVMRRAEQLFAQVPVISRHGPGRVVRATYGAVAQNARRLATALQARGIEPGMRVATLMWNHAAHLAAYYAVPAIDAVLHPLNPRLSAEELAYIVADAGDMALLIDDDLLPLWQQVSAYVDIPHVIVHALGEPSQAQVYSQGKNWPLWHDVLAESEPLAAWPDGPVDENAPVSICYTSGTTGRPKGVVYSHRSILLHGLAVATPDALNLSGRDTLLTLTPMFHVNAWSMPYTAPLLGAAQVLTGPRASSADILDLMVSEKVTAALGVPTVWTDVLAAIDQHPGRWSLRAGTRIYSGGAAPSPEMFRRFDRLGLNLQTGWGMTECSPMGSQVWLRPECDGVDDEARLKLRTSNGLPLPFVEMRHVNDSGQVQPWDGQAMGELQVRGPWVTGAYIGHLEPISATTEDGWLKTGDIVVFEPNGYLRLVDRLKDLVKSGGEWISSVDMEKALCDHPDVLEAAVIAVPDAHWGERPLAVVQRKPHCNSAADAIRAHLSTRFPKWMVPEQIVFTEAMPRTAVGKLNKMALRKQFVG